MTLKLTASDYKALVAILEAYGGSIVTTDIEKIYDKFPAPSAIRRQFYTSLSDGKYIFVDNKRVHDTNSLAWDIVHLLGHMLQWSLSRDKAREIGLQYYGSAARRMAVKDFRAANDAVLESVIKYELEANYFAFSILLGDRHEKVDSLFAVHFREFIQSDLSFIVDYYYQYREQRHANNVKTDPILGPILTTVGSNLRRVKVPAPAKHHFRSFDILSVPVVHASKSNHS